MPTEGTDEGDKHPEMCGIIANPGVRPGPVVLPCQAFPLDQIGYRGQIGDDPPNGWPFPRGKAPK